MHGQLAVDLVHLLEAGLILQAENQDGCIKPGAELERLVGSGEKERGREESRVENGTGKEWEMERMGKGEEGVWSPSQFLPPSLFCSLRCEGNDWYDRQQCFLTHFLNVSRETHARTCASGGPASSLMSKR